MKKTILEHKFETLLSALFDYQRFDPNPHLAAVLRSVEHPSADDQKLDENALEQLSAAGTGDENLPESN